MDRTNKLFPCSPRFRLGLVSILNHHHGEVVVPFTTRPMHVSLVAVPHPEKKPKILLIPGALLKGVYNLVRKWINKTKISLNGSFLSIECLILKLSTCKFFDFYFILLLN